MGRRTRECLLCGTKYEYCPTCSQDKMKPSWMAEFHNENCKNIFDICTRFNMQLMDKAEAQVALKECDLSGKANFKPFAQKDFENIFAEDKVIVPVEAEITEDEVVVEVAPVTRGKSKSKSHEVVNKTEE